MRIFFTDDSETNGDRDGMGRLVAHGGLHVGEEALGPLEEDLENILDDLGIPRDTEIKWSPAPGNHIREELDGDTRRELYQRCLGSAREYEAQAIVAIIDTGRTTMGTDPAARWTLKFVFERLNTQLEKREEFGLVVTDKPGGDEMEFLENFVGWVQEGTEYSPGERVLLNALPSPSRFVRHLQLADLVTAVTTAMVAGYYRYASPVFDEIKPLLITNALGKVGGTGLKLFPDELINLYHWVLEENAFTKARHGMGIRLPDPRYPYSEEDGAA